MEFGLAGVNCNSGPPLDCLEDGEGLSDIKDRPVYEVVWDIQYRNSTLLSNFGCELPASPYYW